MNHIIKWCTDSRKLARELRWVAFQAIVQAIISILNNFLKKRKIPAAIDLNYFQPYTEYASNIGEN